VAYFSALFTHYSGIDHFEMIEARVLKLLHKKIHPGSEYVHLFKLVNLVGASLSALLIPALIRGHLLNQFMSFLNTESEERNSSGSIYMLLGQANQLMIESLGDELLLHAVIGACSDIIPQVFPCLSDGLICELLKPRDLGEKNLPRNASEHFSQVDTASLLEYKYCFAFPNNENGKKRRRMAS
jgi:hypothetical protein